MDRDRLLEQERAGWEAFEEVVDGLDAERLEEPTVTPEGWSVRDVLVHVAAWLDDCGTILERIDAGTYDAETAPEEAPGYVERANAEHAVRARTMSVAAARSYLAEARMRAREAFAALDDPDVTAWQWFEESGPMHYAEHTHDLTAWAIGEPSDPQVGPLLQEETDAWVPLAAAFDALEASAPVIAPPGWTAGDLAFHVAVWLEVGAADVEANRGWAHAGEQDSDAIVDAMNATFLEEGRSLDPVAIRGRLERARTRMRAALARGVAPSEATKTWFRVNGVEHYAEHVDDLRASAG
ncbi:MAG TPA: maleylpyruvate isomerase N-terminal domain-containing protein [Actinomycetota bacterium]